MGCLQIVTGSRKEAALVKIGPFCLFLFLTQFLRRIVDALLQGVPVMQQLSRHIIDACGKRIELMHMVSGNMRVQMSFSNAADGLVHLLHRPDNAARYPCPIHLT